MSRRRAISEELKLRIAELYHNSDISVGLIADALGVSVRTVHNYKNYSPSESFDQEDDQSEYEESVSIKKNQWQCKRCGFITDRRLNYCHSCGCGPFDSFFIKVGSPEHESFVNQRNKEPESEENFEGEEEFCDPTKDYWVCKECDYISNTKFDICPECECEEIIFAPEGKEPRDPEKYLDSNESIGISEENDTNNQINEESEKEFDWECYHCHNEFNGNPRYCPYCGVELDYD